MLAVSRTLPHVKIAFTTSHLIQVVQPSAVYTTSIEHDNSFLSDR